MRELVLQARIVGVDADTVYGNIIQFDRYSDLAPHVRSATVHETYPAPFGSSSWELHFRSGLLRWTESETFLRDELRVDFTQSEGDFDEFDGSWQLVPAGADTELTFTACFDFGVPSLEGILDPIAERVIKETVAWAVAGLHDEVVFSEQFSISPAAVVAPSIPE